LDANSHRSGSVFKANQQAGNRWQVKAQLEVQDFPRLSPDEVQVAAVLGPDAIALGDRLHAWLNQTIVASDYW
jgi:hypothetical protein